MKYLLPFYPQGYHFQKNEESPDLKFFLSPVCERQSAVLRASRTQNLLRRLPWWATFFRTGFNFWPPSLEIACHGP